MLLLRRVGPGASWVADVLPGVVVFGAGLALTVAPLTATVLASAPDRFVGAASGVNNAVARAAGLLSVAVIPGLAGIGGADYTDPVAFDAGFRTALLISAGTAGRGRAGVVPAGPAAGRGGGGRAGARGTLPPLRDRRPAGPPGRRAALGLIRRGAGCPARSAGRTRRGRIDHSRRTQLEGLGQRPQAGQRVGAGRGQQLDAHVVRTGVEVGA